LEQLGTIGTDTASGARLDGYPVDVVRMASGQFAVLAGSNPQIFDSTGKFLRTIRVRGTDSSRFLAFPKTVRVGTNDTMYFASGGRISVFDPAGTFVRVVTLAPNGSGQPIPITGGKYVGVGSLQLRGGRVEPGSSLLHLYTEDGRLLRSFGPVVPPARQISGYDNGRDSYLWIGRGSSGTLWSAPLAPYELREWDADGALLRVIRRDSSLVGPGPEDWRNIYSVEQDAAGRLWVLIQLPEPRAIVVDVLRASDGQLIASATMPGGGYSPHPFLAAPGYLAMYAQQNGTHTLVLLKATLTQR
jgi:hypothetical protein